MDKKDQDEQSSLSIQVAEALTFNIQSNVLNYEELLATVAHGLLVYQSLFYQASVNREKI